MMFSIKPLEWSGRSSNGKIHKAYVVPMEYWAWENAGFGYWSWGSLAGREVYGGLDGAKAAAQADYEQRIFSALSIPPAAVESNASVEAAHLFCEKDFIGAGGQSLSWKIECDVLSDADLKTIAAVCAPSLPKFCEAVGVPCGGLRLAAAMNAYADSAAKRVLIVDDVWTTGKSMTAIGASYAEWIGFVAFARGPLPSHVSSFMSISSVSVEARLREALELGRFYAGLQHDEAIRCHAYHAASSCEKDIKLIDEALSAVGYEAKKSEGGVDWDDVRGIAPNATGDLSSEAFIREQRDSWDDQPSSPPPAAGIIEREIAAQSILARVRRVRDEYANQAKFADVDQASYFREFIRRLDNAINPKPSTSPWNGREQQRNTMGVTAGETATSSDPTAERREIVARDRQFIIDLIREKYDPVPSDWLAKDAHRWDDGTGEIADTILAALDGGAGE